MRSSLLALALAIAAVAGCSDPGPVPDDDVPGCDAEAAAYSVWVADQAEGRGMAPAPPAGPEPDALELVGQTMVGGAPHNITFSADRHFAYITNLGAAPAP